MKIKQALFLTAAVALTSFGRAQSADKKIEKSQDSLTTKQTVTSSEWGNTFFRGKVQSDIQTHLMINDNEEDPLSAHDYISYLRSKLNYSDNKEYIKNQIEYVERMATIRLTELHLLKGEPLPVLSEDSDGNIDSKKHFDTILLKDLDGSPTSKVDAKFSKKNKTGYKPK